MEESQVVIVDFGSHQVRAGTNTNSVPLFIEASCGATTDTSDTLLFSEAIKQKDKWPLWPLFSNGVPTKEGLMELLWKEIFQKLKISEQLSSASLFVVDSGITPLSYRKKEAEIVFEKFNVKSLLRASTPIMSMYCTGGDTGLIVECGHSLTQVVPIFKGFCISPGIMRSLIGGKDVTERLYQAITLKGAIPHKNMREIVSLWKEQHCTFDSSTPVDVPVELPDGNKLNLQQELIESPEILFNPQKFSLETQGIVSMIIKSVFRHCDLYSRADLFKNIMLLGGSTLLHNFDNKLQAEMKQQVSSSVPFEIQTSLDRRNSAWTGALVFSCTDLLSTLSIMREDYLERGSDLVNQFHLYFQLFDNKKQL